MTPEYKAKKKQITSAGASIAGQSVVPDPTATDDFWDISRMASEKKRPTAPVGASRSHTEAVEIELPQPSTAAPSSSLPPVAAQIFTDDPTSVVGVTHFVPPHKPEEAAGETPADTYVPEGAFLHRVKIYDWPSGYHYFDQFIKDAEYFAAMRGVEAAREPFFSYFPQYVQLSRRQMAWYLWWRELARGGHYVATDYAYVLLYIFELLNLPTSPGTTEGRDALAGVWMAYRTTYRQLDHYMCEWLCDYCLIHHLPAPAEILDPAMDDIVKGSRLKEFYLSSAISAYAGKNDLATARILLVHCCHYDYRKSKFATGEHKALFDRVIPAAVAAMVPRLTGREGQPPMITLQESMATRDAYVGALCAYRNKCRIEVEYTSFSRSHELRFLIGDMVKHIENRLRGRIGVRSRLSTMSLPVSLRDALDEYLRAHLPEEHIVGAVARKKPPQPDYEKPYDLPRKAVSLADADAIEQASWHTTRLLIEAFSDQPAAEDKPPMPSHGGEVPSASPLPCAEASTPLVKISRSPEDTSRPPENTERPPVGTSRISMATAVDQPKAAAREIPLPTPSADGGMTGAPSLPTGDGVSEVSPLAAALGFDRCTFLRLCLEGDTAGQRAFCSAHRRMPDAMADEINRITVDNEIFDTVLEDDGHGGFAVIDDYRDGMTDMLAAALKGE